MKNFLKILKKYAIIKEKTLIIIDFYKKLCYNIKKIQNFCGKNSNFPLLLAFAPTERKHSSRITKKPQEKPNTPKY